MCFRSHTERRALFHRVLAKAQLDSRQLLDEITSSTARAEKKKAEVQTVKDMLESEATSARHPLHSPPPPVCPATAARPRTPPPPASLAARLRANAPASALTTPPSLRLLAVINSDKLAVEEDLAAAKPALDEAEAALSAITAKDIGMLAALKKPPELIKRLFDCVLVLFMEEMIPSATEKPKDRLQVGAGSLPVSPIGAGSLPVSPIGAGSLPVSPLYLPCASPVSPVCLPCISPLHLPCSSRCRGSPRRG